MEYSCRVSTHSKTVTVELKNLLAHRAMLEQKSLHSELQNIASQAIAAGQHGGTRQVLAAVGAGANTILAFCEGAFDDYKAVIDVDPHRFKAGRLDAIKRDFLKILRDEREAVYAILDKRVGGIARHYSQQGLSQYKQFDTEFVAAYNAAESKAELYNKKVGESAPTFLTAFKSKWESNRLMVLIVGGYLLAASLAGTVKGISEAWTVVKDLLK